MKVKICKIIFPLILLFSGCKKEIKNTQIESIKKVSFEFRKGENLSYVLLWKIPFITPSDAIEFQTEFSKNINPKKIQEKDKFIFWFDSNNNLKKVEYHPVKKPEKIYIFKKTNGYYQLDTIKKKISIDTFVYFIEIENSLYHSLSKFKKGEYLTDIIAEIFAWVIDFNTEIRTGDSIIIIGEKKFIEDRFYNYGNIFLCIYKGKQTKTKKAFLYKENYYNEEGHSLKKYFLRSPLPYYRITSGFSKRRFHPILRVYRPHHGIDYAAPEGTPVFAIGDGRVIFAGWKKGYGLFVLIKHKNNYISGYGHLKRIRVRKGQYVYQKQIIGYVGSTGLSTGPHLHFELRKKGRFLNFLKIKFPPQKILKGKELEKFKLIQKKWLSYLKKMKNRAISYYNL